MIRYLLDTDVVSQAGKAEPQQNVMDWLKSVDDNELSISVITLRERLEGARKASLNRLPRAAEIAADVEDLAAAYAGRVLPIDERAARRWAELLVPDKSRSDDKGQVAIAMAHGLTLVALNTKDLRSLGAPVLNPSRKPPKLYPA